MPHNKINKGTSGLQKPLVVYRFSGNVITSIITLHKIREKLDVFTPKMQFLMSYDK